MNLIGPIYNGIISLLTRWTQALADRLDAAISSRAPASTALSTATWTGTKAGYLDTTVSSRAPASTALDSGVWTSTRAGKLDNLDATIGSCTRIKSIQRGIITLTTAATSASATIASVVMAKTELRFLGFSQSVASSSPQLFLANSTTITASRYSTEGGVNIQISWELTEYY